MQKEKKEKRYPQENVSAKVFPESSGPVLFFFVFEVFLFSSFFFGLLLLLLLLLSVSPLDVEKSVYNSKVFRPIFLGLLPRPSRARHG